MMLKSSVLLSALLIAITTAASAAEPETPKKKSAKEIIDAAPASAWRMLDPANTLYMELPAGRVVIELAPGFAPAHVANIKAMAKGGFWDGLSIYRAQDNFVVQFGDADGDDKAKARPFPAGTKEKLPAEFTRRDKNLAFNRLPDADGWAPQVGFADGFPVAHDPRTGETWMTHCYGMLGAGRSNPPDSSIGAELYVVIGQAPRGLDLNITVVGRVLKGMELLSALPRGTAAMGFYDKPEQRTGIQRIRLLAQVPPAERPALQVLKTESGTWTQLLDSRRFRGGWFVHSPGHIEVCSASVPTRPTPPLPAQAPK